MPEPPSESLRSLDAELELGERLGSGAMGSVYRARERASGREVAVKVLNAQTASAASRFLREGQVTAGLQHPGIVRVHSIGTLRGRPCLSYELVPGARSFEAAIEASPALAVPLLIQAGEALGAAHALGLTHRDVKSENLLVDPSGRLRVADFGLVTGEELSRLTQSGALVGTPMAMAPEQFSGARERVGPPTDVWALGVLLYRALAGVYPFEADNMLALAGAISSGDFPPPSRVRPTPAPLEAVCLRALSLAPAERYPDGAAFAEALAAAAAAPTSSGRALWLIPLGILGLGLAGLGLASALLPSAPPPLLAASSPSATPSPSSPSPPSSLDDILQTIRGWSFGALEPLPARLREPELYTDASANFHSLLDSLGTPEGAGSQSRAARALLDGSGVRADPAAALAILRHAAQGRDPECQALLIETLAAEGLRDEELVWLGRLVLDRPRPFELHRLWRIARDPEDSRSSLAKRVWAEIPPSAIRWTLVDHLEGRRTRVHEAPRAEGRELRDFLCDAALRSWERDESPASDWELGALLDLLPHASRLRLIELASPSRRLARLCLARESSLRERTRPENLQVLEAALRPTLAKADEEWLIEVVETLLRGGATPPSLVRFVERLRRLKSRDARRWFALCLARGFGTPNSPAGVKALHDLRQEGDHEAALLIASNARPEPSREVLTRLLEPGLAAEDPATLTHVARDYLDREGPGGPGGRLHLALLERAVASGYPPAQAMLGSFLETSLASPQHMRRSVELLQRAADQDHLTAMKRLAIFRHAGFGCAADPAAARALMARAALLGDANATLHMARWLHAKPEGESPRAAEARVRLARSYLRRAERLGLEDPAALERIRFELEDPATRERGYQDLHELARRLPKSAASTDLARELIERGQTQRAEELLRGLSNDSNSLALQILLDLYRAEDRHRDADALLEQGVARGSVIHLLYAGRDRFAENPREGEALLVRAAQRGRPQAFVILGQFLWERGERQRAWQFWLLAHRARSSAAMRKLAEHPWPE